MAFDPHAASVAFRHVQLAHVAIELRLPQLLSDAARSEAELASQTGVPAERLRRVLRGLIWAGLLRFDEGMFSLTEDGRKLIDDAPMSMANGIRFQVELFNRPWMELGSYVRSGRVPFEVAQGGQSVFEMLGQSSEVARLYAGPMGARTKEYSEAIAAHPALAAARRIVDVGGGSGQLLIELLKRHSHLSGIVFDLPAMRDSAVVAIAEANVGDRVTFIGGDMFQSVPPGADVYLLKWVLHDWADEAAVRIVRQCASAMQDAGSQLLVIERIMAEQMNESVALAQADLNMLCQSGGAERTLGEYRRLLAAGGLELRSVTQLKDTYGFYILTAGK